METVTYPNLLNREQAALYLGVAPQTLAVWACTGRYGLRYIKCGRLVKYRKSDLDAFLERRTVESTGELSPAGSR